MASPIVSECPGCGAAITDRFCSRCGERRPGDSSIRCANVAFFVISGALHVRALDTPLAQHLRVMPYRALAATLVDQRLAERHVTAAEYGRTFDAVAATQARSLVIVMVPALALLVWLVNRRRSRYALHHLVFALHFYVVFFAIIVGIAVLAVGLAKVLGPTAVQGADPVLSAIVLAVTTTYLARAERRAYGTSGIGTVVRGAFLAVGTLLVLGAYRGLLFFTTFLVT